MHPERITEAKVTTIQDFEQAIRGFLLLGLHVLSAIKDLLRIHNVKGSLKQVANAIKKNPFPISLFTLRTNPSLFVRDFVISPMGPAQIIKKSKSCFGYRTFHVKFLTPQKGVSSEACRRTQWHTPIPQILSATLPAQISGYPVYDRELLKPELLEKAGAVTLIGDAAHPMSPFKGQGANQALLDALALARRISIACTTLSKWRETGVREMVLTGFEEEMLARSSTKVKDSAEAVELLHSKVVLREGDGPKGRSLRGNNKI